MPFFLLGDASGYDAYYEILIGERKSGASVIEEHKQLLKTFQEDGRAGV